MQCYKSSIHTDGIFFFFFFLIHYFFITVHLVHENENYVVKTLGREEKKPTPATNTNIKFNQNTNAREAVFTKGEESETTVILNKLHLF